MSEFKLRYSTLALLLGLVPWFSGYLITINDCEMKSKIIRAEHCHVECITLI